MKNLDFELLPIYFQKFKKKMDKLIDNDLKEYDISCMHFRPIVVLYKTSGLSLNELTDIIGVDKANITRVINELKKREIVYQIEDKKRGYKIKLTDKGNNLAGFIFDKRKKVDEKIFSNFSSSEKEQFLNLILKYFDGINSFMEVNDEKNS